MRALSLSLLVLVGCRCGSDLSPTDAPPATRARLELADEVAGLPSPALALASLGGHPVVGRRGALGLASGALDAPAYLRGPIVVSNGVIHAWPYEVGAREQPVELAVPEGPAIVSALWTAEGWRALRGAPETRELVGIEASPRVLGAVPGTSILAADSGRLAAAGTSAYVFQADALVAVEAPRYEVRALAFAGPRLLGLDAVGALVIWDLEGSTTTTLVAHLGDADALAVGDPFVATGGSDGRVAIWRLADLPPAATSAEPIAEATFAGRVDALVWERGTNEPTVLVAVTEGRRSRLVRMRLREPTR